MAIKGKIEIKGIAELNKKLRNLPKEIEKDVDRELKISALEVETEAKIRCPIDTGRLRSSIHTSGDNLEYFVGTNVEYSQYVERKKPYLFPALEAKRQGIIKRIEDIIGRPSK